MNVADLCVQIFIPPGSAKRMTGYAAPLQQAGVLTRMITDEGLEGISLTWVPRHPPRVLAEAVLALKPLVIGEHPLDIERIWQRNFAATRQTLTLMAPGAIDWSLWDLAGKIAGLPLYRLLGGYRDRLPAYASTYVYGTVEEYVQAVLGFKAHGFRAIKLHPWGDPSRDIELCRAVRDAVGPGYPLMLDCVGCYDRAAALRVGRVLDELAFHWYEEPLPDDDLEGYVELCRALDTPVAGVDAMRFTLGIYAQYIAHSAFDIVRADAARHGITMARKVAILAESFGLKFEPHGYALALGQAANLHLSASLSNSEFFEMPVPAGIMDAGMAETIRLEPDGCVAVPQKPGLGLEIDWDEMRPHLV
jgi:L-alanine-DL-glutamate epimerase-like enolase superfamily enzyme